MLAKVYYKTPILSAHKFEPKGCAWKGTNQQRMSDNMEHQSNVKPRRRSSLLNGLVINSFHLPAPNSPLKRQIGVCSDGTALSPISLARSISNQSDDDATELFLRRSLLRYKHRLEENLEKFVLEKITVEDKLEHPYDENEKNTLQKRWDEVNKIIDIVHDKISAVDRLLCLL